MQPATGLHGLQSWRVADAQRPEKVKLAGRLQPFEKEYFRKDGTRVPVLVGVARFEETRNQAVAFALDMSEQKRVERALRRSEAFLAEGQRLGQTGSFSWRTGRRNHITATN
jgi:hypothetical protein